MKDIPWSLAVALILIPTCAITQSQMAPSKVVKGSRRWTVSIKKDPTEDTVETSFTLPSNDATARLSIRCTGNWKFGDGHRGIAREFAVITNKYIAPNSWMTIRMDEDEPMHKKSTISTNYKAMFLEDQGGMRSWYENTMHAAFPDELTDFAVFIPQLLAAKRALVKLEIFQSSERVWTFSPAGADADRITKTCGLQQ